MTIRLFGGCVRIVLVSQIRFSKSASDGGHETQNPAGLLLHEVIYTLYTLGKVYIGFGAILGVYIGLGCIQGSEEVYIG